MRDAINISKNHLIFIGKDRYIKQYDNIRDLMEVFRNKTKILDHVNMNKDEIDNVYVSVRESL